MTTAPQVPKRITAKKGNHNIGIGDHAPEDGGGIGGNPSLATSLSGPSTLSPWKKDSDTRLILTWYLIGEPDHSGPTIASSPATLQTGATATSTATWQATITSVTAPTTTAFAATGTTTAAERTCAATTSTTKAASLATSTWSWLGGSGCECVVLHIVIADLDTLAAPCVNVVLPGLRTCGIYQLHQHLGGRYQLGVYPDGGQLRGERLLPGVGGFLMLGEDQFGFRSAREATLHLGLEALVSVLYCRRCRVLNACRCARREGHLDQRDRVHVPIPLPHSNVQYDGAIERPDGSGINPNSSARGNAAVFALISVLDLAARNRCPERNSESPIFCFEGRRGRRPTRTSLLLPAGGPSQSRARCMSEEWEISLPPWHPLGAGGLIAR